MSESIEELLPYLDRIPELEGVDRGTVKAERLGGLTNQNHKIETPLGNFVLRIPGEGTSEYISRENESQAARITSEIGVNAPLVYFDKRDGVQLTRFLEGAATMNTGVSGIWARCAAQRRACAGCTIAADRSATDSSCSR
jgi:hypothetical protein